jgi:hypothetical protein
VTNIATFTSTGLTVNLGGVDSTNTGLFLSGGAAKYAAVTVGRTATDIMLGTCGQVNNFFNGTAVADVVLTGAAGNMWIGNTSNAGIAFMTNNTLRMSITNAGVIVDANNNELGFKDLPFGTAKVAPYTVASTDRGMAHRDEHGVDRHDPDRPHSKLSHRDLQQQRFRYHAQPGRRGDAAIGRHRDYRKQDPRGERQGCALVLQPSRVFDQRVGPDMTAAVTMR